MLMNFGAAMISCSPSGCQRSAAPLPVGETGGSKGKGGGQGGGSPGLHNPGPTIRGRKVGDTLADERGKARDPFRTRAAEPLSLSGFWERVPFAIRDDARSAILSAEER